MAVTMFWMTRDLKLFRPTAPSRACITNVYTAIGIIRTKTIRNAEKA